MQGFSIIMQGRRRAIIQVSLVEDHRTVSRKYCKRRIFQVETTQMLLPSALFHNTHWILGLLCDYLLASLYVLVSFSPKSTTFVQTLSLTTSYSQRSTDPQDANYPKVGSTYGKSRVCFELRSSLHCLFLTHLYKIQHHITAKLPWWQ
jgi:hypothetical protein